ncbi:MAG: CPBP family intramembrane glutamic endopeptidase [Planktotalea sp.]|uniref:CPBP family intramembrane glutamic endopeptidase n=1 Tax=Planktotalea sp. TaxID=2029877 RepID=UPI003C773887
MLKTVFAFDYSAHARFVAPARDAAEVWRLVLGLILAVFIIWVSAPLLWQVLFYGLSDDAYRTLYDDFETLLLPQSLLLMLFSFGFVWLAVAAVALMLHQRRPETLIGSPPIAWMQAKFVIVALAILFAVLFMLPPYRHDPPLQEGADLGRWIALLAPALLAIFIQTSAEEVLFRGYMQQQLAARFSNPLVWLFVPSALFGLAHYAPGTYGGNAWLVVIWAAIFGLFAADLTARSGTLGPAIALHFVTNISALLLIAPQGEMSGLALYRYGFSAADEAAVRAFLPVDFAVMLVSWLTARLALRR